ncbi:hypothetical protein ALC56_11761, partial [Trachymyrmex septentrionalis]
ITTTKSLEFCINYLAIFIDLDLKFHYITTSRCSYKTCPNLFIILIQGTNISGIFITNINKRTCTCETYAIKGWDWNYDKDKKMTIITFA